MIFGETEEEFRALLVDEGSREARNELAKRHIAANPNDEPRMLWLSVDERPMRRELAVLTKDRKDVRPGTPIRSMVAKLVGAVEVVVSPDAILNDPRDIVRVTTEVYQ